MAGTVSLAILSDVHYAGAAEQARGSDYEYRTLPNPFVRYLVRLHRHVLWLREPFSQNHLLDVFVEQAAAADYVVANGDYSCNSAFVGVSDDAACQSAKECLDKLRRQFGERLRANFGDHELGKLSFVGRRGGMRLASWWRGREELGLQPFWQLRLGKYVLLGMVSSLVGLPVFEADTLETERSEWARLRMAHMEEIRAAFASLRTGERLLLFCHDPTALPFLWRDEVIRSRLSQVEQTIIGHLHSNLILRQSRVLAGMPTIRFLGHTARRLSAALREAKQWQPFKVRLCPSLAGIELLKDGGYYTANLDLTGLEPAQFTFHHLPRSRRHRPVMVR